MEQQQQKEKRVHRQMIPDRRDAMKQAMLEVSFKPDEQNVETTLLQYLEALSKRGMPLVVVEWTPPFTTSFGVKLGGDINLFFRASGMEWIVGATENDHAAMRRHVCTLRACVAD